MGSFIDADIGPFDPSISKGWGNVKEMGLLETGLQIWPLEERCVCVISTIHIQTLSSTGGKKEILDVYEDPTLVITTLPTGCGVLM